MQVPFLLTELKIGVHHLRIPKSIGQLARLEKIELHKFEVTLPKEDAKARAAEFAKATELAKARAAEFAKATELAKARTAEFAKAERARAGRVWQELARAAKF